MFSQLPFFIVHFRRYFHEFFKKLAASIEALGIILKFF